MGSSRNDGGRPLRSDGPGGFPESGRRHLVVALFRVEGDNQRSCAAGWTDCPGRHIRRVRAAQCRQWGSLDCYHPWYPRRQREYPGVPFHRAGNGLRRYERGIRGFERCRSDLGTEEYRSRGNDAGGIADTAHRNCRALAGCRHAGHGNPLAAGSGVLRDEGRRQPLETSAVVDEQTGRFYAGTDTKGVYVSQDGGTRWSRSSSGLSAILSVSGAVNTIAVARDGIVYAGTQARGAAMSRDEGAAWQRLNSGLPELDVQHIVVHRDRLRGMDVHDGGHVAPVRRIGLAVAAILHRADVLEHIRRESSPCQPLVRGQLWEDGIGRQQDAVSPFVQVHDAPVEGFVASHDVVDVVEDRHVELHDAVPNGLLVDALVQGLELSPELHQVAAARACVRLHARRRNKEILARFSRS
jgi:hypothetical protein